MPSFSLVACLQLWPWLPPLAKPPGPRTEAFRATSADPCLGVINVAHGARCGWGEIWLANYAPCASEVSDDPHSGESEDLNAFYTNEKQPHVTHVKTHTWHELCPLPNTGREQTDNMCNSSNGSIACENHKAAKGAEGEKGCDDHTSHAVCVLQN